MKILSKEKIKNCRNLWKVTANVGSSKIIVLTYSTEELNYQEKLALLLDKHPELKESEIEFIREFGYETGYESGYESGSQDNTI